jgi:hypothetical protein
MKWGSRVVLFFALVLLVLPSYTLNLLAQDQDEELNLYYQIMAVVTKASDTEVELAGAIKIDPASSKVYLPSRQYIDGEKYSVRSPQVKISSLKPGTVIFTTDEFNPGDKSLLHPPSLYISYGTESGRLSGILRKVDLHAGRIRVVNQDIPVIGTTVVLNLKNQNKLLPLRDLEIGSSVDVKVDINGRDLIAQSVSQSAFRVVESFNNDFIIGPILKIQGDRITILSNDLVVNLDGVHIHTNYDKCRDIALSELKPGMIMSVSLQSYSIGVNAPKTLEASVWMDDEGNMIGIPTELNEQTKSFKIAGQQIFVDEETMIGFKAQPAGFEDIRAAERLSINFRVRKGKIFARQIWLIKSNSSFQCPTECNGPRHN